MIRGFRSICDLVTELIVLFAALSAVVPVAFAAGDATSFVESTALDSSSNVATIGEIHLGFGGAYKLGFWTPVTVDIHSTVDLAEADLELIVPDGDATPTRYRLPVSRSEPRESRAGGGGAPMSGNWTAQSQIKIGRYQGKLKLTLTLADQPLADRRVNLSGPRLRPALEDGESLIVTIGDLPGAERGLRETSRARGLNIAAATVTQTEQLPTEPFGYEGVDAVVINSASKLTAEFAADVDRLRAFETWLRSGGRVILAAGDQAAVLSATLSGANSFERLLPGAIDGIVPFTNALPYEEFCKTGDPMRLKNDPAAELWNYPRLTGVRGDILLKTADDGSPLIVRSTWGMGQVVFLACDLNAEAMSAWSATGTLIAQLLPAHVGEHNASNTSSLASHTGYRDITGQLRAVLDDFEADGVRRIPFWLLATFALVYLAMIAVVDYWLLRKLHERMEWTWISFPIMVIAGCGIAWAIADNAKGHVVRVNQAEVVDVDIAEGELRGSTWFTVFSPATQAYDFHLSVEAIGMTVTDSPEQHEVPSTKLLSWQGLPGTALGGMQSPASMPLFEIPYDIGTTEASLRGVPMSIWSTKTFRARYHLPVVKAFRLDVKLDPGAIDPLLIGTVTNRLDIPLDNCVLLYRGSVYKLGRLEPGVATPLPEQWASESIRYFLTGNQKYDQTNSEVSTVLQAMMFHEQAGGVKYTHLHNRRESQLDFSHQLEAGRPILIGRASRPIASIMLATSEDRELLGDAATVQCDTIYRFLFDDPAAVEASEAKESQP